MKKQFLFPAVRVLTADIIETQVSLTLNGSMQGDPEPAPGRAGNHALHPVTDFAD